MSRTSLSSPDPPARRIAVRLSILFLLSLAAFAAFTMARATDASEAGEEIAAGTLVLHPRGGGPSSALRTGADLPAVRLGVY